MRLPARQRRLEADAQKRPHLIDLAEEKRRPEQQPDLHAVGVAELQSREHGERAPRRSLRQRRMRPEIARAFDGEVGADLALARLGPQRGERSIPVCPPSVSPKTKPRAPPRIAPSSMKEPSRALSDATCSGPACTARA